MDLTEIINRGANVTISVSPKDLKNFAIDCAREYARSEKPPSLKKSEEYKTIDQVTKLLSVSRVTLWQWEKKGILLPARLGKFKRYRLSDIERLLTVRAEADSTKMKGLNNGK